MKRKAFIQAVIIFCLLAGSWVLLLMRFTGEKEQPVDPPSEEAGKKGAEVATSSPVDATLPKAPEPVETVPAASAPQRWQPWIDIFASADSPLVMRGAITDLKNTVYAMPAGEAVSLIMEFLESGLDVRTGLAFQVGPDGELIGAGSLRAMLLDWLYSLDPEGAFAIAAEELASVGTALSPAEYTIHLRNYARRMNEGATGSRQFLKDRFSELINHKPWTESPSSAVAAAFDVAVHSESTEFIPRFVELMRKGGPQVIRRSAAMSVERLIDRAPVESLSRILEEADQPTGLYKARAGYFARLDPDLPGAERVFETYLASSGVSEAEVTYFLQSFPNLNQTLSHDLLSNYNSNTTPGDHTDRLEKALAQIRVWQADPEMAEYGTTLREVEERLEGHLGKNPGP